MKTISLLSLLLSLLISSHAVAETSKDNTLKKLRWTLLPQSGSWSQVLPEVAKQLQIPLVPEDFKLIEQKNLNGMNFSWYQQSVAGVVVENAGIRIWQNPQDQSVLQMIAFVQNPQSANMLTAVKQQSLFGRIESKNFTFKDAAALSSGEIKKLKNYTQSLRWVNEKLVRVVQVFGHDRSIEFHLDPATSQILSQRLRLYPRADLPPRENQVDEFSVQGKAFKVNEEFEMPYGRKGSGARPETVELKFLKKQFTGTKVNWIENLPRHEFSEAMMDPVKAATPEGQAAGYWSRQSIMDMINQATQVLPLHENIPQNGMYLAGRYVQVAIHDDAFKQFQIASFQPFYSNFTGQSYAKGSDGTWNITLNAASLGRPFFSAADLMNRQAPYEIKRDTNAMINEGFDEMQVYWSVTAWFELMHQAGFTDTELSTRPIQAFLFDPSIESQDNAYYNEDTINFTTYSERNGNEARNLITVWHELGHGLMDRLQGSSGFDNGGLSEGIADFAAEMALRGFYRLNAPGAIEKRRINNQIGFQLTNEDHDDGEAYGGSLKDLMDRKIKAEGFSGYAKTSDLVLDAMRLTRASPQLSITDWFEALLLADQIGKPGLRDANEFSNLLVETFADRNYTYQSSKAANLQLIYEGREIDDRNSGSRNSPVPISVAVGATKDLFLNVKISIEENKHYTYPLKVVVSYKESNALQGALKFTDESDAVFTIKGAGETLTIPVQVAGGCDFINSSQGYCKDFLNVQVFSKDQRDAFAKKRFYLMNRF